jgi:hypothetical protein
VLVFLQFPQINDFVHPGLTKSTFFPLGGMYSSSRSIPYPQLLQMTPHFCAKLEEYHYIVSFLAQIADGLGAYWLE